MIETLNILLSCTLDSTVGQILRTVAAVVNRGLAGEVLLLQPHQRLQRLLHPARLVKTAASLHT